MSKTIKFIVLIVIVLGFYGCTDWDRPRQTQLQTEDDNQERMIRGELVIKTGQASTSHLFETKKKSTVFDVMTQLERRKKLDIEYRESSAGIFVVSIEGLANNQEKDKYWMLYVNGEMSDSGASYHIIRDGDVIEWKYMDVSNIAF